MKYILDFDRTLFDTDKLVAQFQAAGLSLAQLSPEMLQPYPTKEYLYDDTVTFLSNKRQEDVFVLTALGDKYGDKILSFQTAKIDQEPIKSLVHEVVYVQEEKGVPAAKIAQQFSPEEPIVFVDDLLKNCQAVYRALPRCRCFLIDRAYQYPADWQESGITLVRSLTEVDGMMNTL